MTTGTQFNPEDFADSEGDVWDHARREYLAGAKAAHVCQRYGMSLSSFWRHARIDGWRRMDQPTCDVLPEPGEYHPGDAVSFDDLAQEAFLNIRRALGAGRASEASTWLRVYEKLADRARADAMADTPDVVAPRVESHREPLTLFRAEDENTNDLNAMVEGSEAKPQKWNSCHPVFSESNSRSSPPCREPTAGDYSGMSRKLE